MSGAYGVLADSYEDLNAEIDYSKWADFLVAIFDKYSKNKVESIVDLGCGTGLMTFELAKRGYDMTGVDNSEEMLSIAQSKNKGWPVLLLNQDMINFELYGTVDAAISCLDCVNHILNKKDLDTFFHWVHNYLNPDGVFIFDCNSKYKFENIYGNEAYILESDDTYCGWQNEYNPKSSVCTFYLTKFKEDKDGKYIRQDTIQKEKYYSMNTLDSLLKKNGFDVVGKFSDYNFSEIKADNDRWYYVAIARK